MKWISDNEVKLTYETMRVGDEFTALPLLSDTIPVHRSLTVKSFDKKSYAVNWTNGTSGDLRWLDDRVGKDADDIALVKVVPKEKEKPKDIFNEIHRPNDGPMHYFYKLSRAAHEGAVRRDGRPYISHPRRVADRVKHMGDHLRAAAWMHDVVEDTPLTLKEIGDNAYRRLTTSDEYAFVGKVMEIIDALTHRKDEETYLEYLTRVREAGPDAILVKTADIMDNFTDHPTPAEMVKYPAALLFLAGEDYKGAVETLAGLDSSAGKKEAKAKGRATVEAATRRI